VIGGATMRPSATVSATRWRSSLDICKAKLMPVIPVARRVWGAQTRSHAARLYSRTSPPRRALRSTARAIGGARHGAFDRLDRVTRGQRAVRPMVALCGPRAARRTTGA
jgi:hypothetical protein